MICPKCKEGSLTCEWKSEAYSSITDYGQEWDCDDWIEIILQSCECVFDDEEFESISEKAKEKMTEEFNEHTTVQDAWVIDDMFDQ